MFITVVTIIVDSETRTLNNIYDTIEKDCRLNRLLYYDAIYNKHDFLIIMTDPLVRL